MTLARKVDRLVLKREKKMLVAESHVSTSSIGGMFAPSAPATSREATTSWPVTTLLLPGRRQSRTSKGLWPNYKCS